MRQVEADRGSWVPFAVPRLGQNEVAAFKRVIAQPRLTEGPETVAFEEEFRDYIGGGMAVAVSSCTAALHLAWLAVGLKPGKEVVVPALTHVATAHAIQAAGGEPVVCDVGPDGNVRAEDIEKVLTKRTGGICVVHFLGTPCDMANIMDLARQRNVPVVEDCALSLGTRYGERHVGLLGQAGCFSFYPAKHITTGEGGMLVTTDRKIGKRAKLMRTFGRVTDPAFDIVCYGLNFRMSEIASAIGRSQLAQFPVWLDIRRHNARLLKEALPDSMIGDHYAVSFLADSPVHRQALDTGLRRQNIETSRYYPVPLHKLEYFRSRYPFGTRFPNAERISSRSITLPVGPHIRERDIAMMLGVLCAA